jgi:predicted outer membrane repeat protein
MNHMSDCRAIGSLAVLLLMLGMGPVQAQPSDAIFVDADNTTGTQDGNTWNTAYDNLQTAIDNASDSDEIWVAEGTYTPDPIGTDRSKSFNFSGGKDGLEIFGGFGGTESSRSDRDPGVHPTILSGDIDGDGTLSDNSYHVVHLDGTSDNITTSTVIDGVVITAGHANGTGLNEDDGGGLYCNGSGGGKCNPILRNVVFRGNEAGFGGALFSNGSNSGGESSPRLENVVFVENEATDRGGAIYNDGDGGKSSPYITNVTVVGNTAFYGGALYNDGTNGGTSSPTVKNTILWGNTAESSGDEIYNNEIYNNEATPTITHSVVQDGTNGIKETSGPGTDYKASNIEKNPRFEYAARPAGDDGVFGTDDDGLHVIEDSPVLDAGDDGAVGPSEDITGTDHSGTVDIGAYEGTKPDQARTIYVDAAADGAGDGTSWADADPTLWAAPAGKGALTYATGNDEIWIAEGTYVPDPNADDGVEVFKSFRIPGWKDGVKIYGGFQPGDGFDQRDPEGHPTILSGDIEGDDDTFDPDNNSDGDNDTPTQTDHIKGKNSYQVFVLDGTTGGPITPSTVIDGVTVTAGYTAGVSSLDGAGLYCNGAGSTCSPTLSNVVFKGNWAATSQSAGAVYNNASSGGTSSPRILESVFVGNVAGGNGGAIWNEASSDGTSTPLIASTVFLNNNAEGDHGGGIYNSAESSSDTVNPKIVNATFTKNVTDSDGAAIYNGSDSDATIANSILWENTVPGISNDETGTGTNASLTVTSSLVKGGTVSNDVDPKFRNAADPIGADGRYGTVDDGINLAPDSPALDTGQNPELPKGLSTDVTGTDRTQDLDADGTPTVNIGAYEPVDPRSPSLSVGTFVSATGAYAGYELNPAGSETTVQVRLAPASNPDRDTLIIDRTLRGAVTQTVGTTLRRLKPGTTYEVTAEARNAEGTFVQDPATFDMPPAPDLRVGGGDQTISVRFAGGGVNPSDVTGRLYARAGGGGPYQERPIESTDAGVFEGTIPASLISLKGVDYYAVLEAPSDTLTVPAGSESDAQTAPLHLPVAFETYTSDRTFEAETYQMTSIPAANAKTALTERYGPYEPANWRVVQWDASEGTYREYPDLDSTDLTAGNAFWLITEQGTPLSLSGGRTVDASTPRRVALDPGWNQVGTPFPYPVAWDRIRTKSGFSKSDIDGPYQPKSDRFEKKTALQPWKGAFVYNATETPDTLLIPPVNANAQKAGSKRLAKRTDRSGKSDPRYTLRATARTKTGASTATVGLRADAKAGRDRYDAAKPPAVRPTTQLSVKGPSQKRSVPHAKSIKPTGGNGQTWTLRLRRPEQGDAPSSARLDWSANGTLPEGQSRYVIDPEAETRVAPGKRFSLDTGETKSLKVIVGTERYAEKNTEAALTQYETALRGNYPNPFEEATTLEYTLSREREVTMQVYNVLGQRVETLVDAQTSAGLHTVMWDGTNRYGERVGSGVYFVRMEAGSTTETQKVVLVR